jgi:hypothetical protein
MPLRFVRHHHQGKENVMDEPSEDRLTGDAPHPGPDPDLVASRAGALTAEEQEAGVEDPNSLAQAVLADSETRTFDRDGTAVEHRRSEDTVDPAG